MKSIEQKILVKKNTHKKITHFSSQYLNRFLYSLLKNKFIHLLNENAFEMCLKFYVWTLQEIGLEVKHNRDSVDTRLEVEIILNL